jgi:TonB family protein
MATHAWDTVSKENKEKDRSAFDELTEIAHRVQTFANACALTIGLRVANSDEIVCCARSGPSAGDVGAIMDFARPFASLCIQSGKGVLCEDTETDARLDLDSARALGIRSIVVTPVREDNRVIAILAVFAPFPNAFTGIHLAVMKTSAQQIAAFLQKAHHAPEEDYAVVSTPAPVAVPKAEIAPAEPIAPPPVVVPAQAVAPATPALMAAKPATGVVAEPPIPVVAAPEVSKPVHDMPRRAIENSAAFWSGTAPAAPKPAAFTPVSRIQSVTTVLAEEVKPEVKPEPKLEAKPVVLEAKPVAREVKPVAPVPPREERSGKQNRQIFTTLNAAAMQSKKSRANLIFAGAVAVLVIGAGVMFVRFKLHVATPAVAQHVAEPVNQPTPVPVAEASIGSTGSTSNVPASPTSPTSPALTVNNTPPASTAAAGASPAAKNTTPVSVAQNSSADGSNKKSSKTSATQLEQPTQETVALATSPSKIIPTSPADSGQNTTAAPSLAIGGDSAMKKLSSLSTPGTAAKPAVTTQSTMEPAEVLKKVNPVFPTFARAKGIPNSDVVVMARIGKDGKVSNLQMISGPMIFRDAAFDAIKQWQFKPARLNGQPIEQNQEIRIRITQ